MNWSHRLRQVLNHLDPRPLPPSALAWVERQLSPPERELFFALRRTDQRYALTVAGLVAREDALSLRERWVTGRAALLHDVGKAPAQSGLVVRVSNVLWPETLPRWTPAGLRDGVQALRAHPARGASLLRQARSEPAVVLLVRWHEAEDYPPELPEGLRPLLDVLRRADAGSKRRRA